jgi:membrane protease YdiL (CAAX protease family)
VAILGGLILIGNFFVAGSKENLEQYPQIRISNWSYKSLAVSSITWVLYLTGYEVMFRGLLLFSVYHEFGINTAISLNVLLYALVHLPKGKRETIGSVPLGFILCVLAIHTGSFLVPLLFHIIMALSNDYFAIRKNPDMRIKT